MQLVHSVDGLGSLTGAGVTIGNFDGVHKGHQALIRRTLDVCRQDDLACVLVTFWPHPRLVVSPHKPHAPLTGGWNCWRAWVWSTCWSCLSPRNWPP